MTRLMLTAAVALTAAGFAFAQDKALEGTYTLKSATQGGKAAPAAFVEAMKEVRITASEIVFVGTDGSEQKIGIKLDAKATPTAIDLLPPKDAKDDKPRLGIYKIEKDEVTLVTTSSPEAKRPTDFKGDGEGVRVMVLTKKK